VEDPREQVLANDGHAALDLRRYLGSGIEWVVEIVLQVPPYVLLIPSRGRESERTACDCAFTRRDVELESNLMVLAVSRGVQDSKGGRLFGGVGFRTHPDHPSWSRNKKFLDLGFKGARRMGLPRMTRGRPSA